METVFRLPVVPTGVTVGVRCSHNALLCLGVISYEHLMACSAFGLVVLSTSVCTLWWICWRPVMRARNVIVTV